MFLVDIDSKKRNKPFGNKVDVMKFMKYALADWFVASENVPVEKYT